jgi:hypothetical protein
MAAFIRTSDHLTVTFDNGESVTVYPSNPRYAEIVKALNDRKFELVRVLASPKAAVQEKIAKVQRRGVGAVELRNGVVYYNDKPIHNTLTRRIVEMATEGFDIEPMCKFLANLQNNPSYRAVNELFAFLEKGNLPITEDGHFLAYKKVDDSYKDCHTHTIDNSVGQVVTMPRNQVNQNPNETCSQGLHFCSRSYLASFGGSHTMILKINPADVVAIPTDYNDSKGRCCRYEVIGEVGQGEHLEGTFRPSEEYVPPTETEDEVATESNVEMVDRLDPHDGSVLGSYEIRSAALLFGLTPSAIRRVVRGDRKTAGGWGWAAHEADSEPNTDWHDEKFYDDDDDDDDDYYDDGGTFY